jgi:hypothetical protein
MGLDHTLRLLDALTAPAKHHIRSVGRGVEGGGSGSSPDRGGWDGLGVFRDPEHCRCVGGDLEEGSERPARGNDTDRGRRYAQFLGFPYCLSIQTAYSGRGVRRDALLTSADEPAV